MSYDLANDSMTWPLNPRFNIQTHGYGLQKGGFWLENYILEFAEHTTTHIDAPSHFAKDVWTVDQIPLANLIGPAIKIDISKKVEQDPLSTLNTSDIEEWTSKHGVIPDGAIVFVYTGWGRNYGNYSEYYGTDDLSNSSTYRFPGVGEDAAKLFTRYHETHGNRINGVGIDAASIDVGNSQLFKSHVELCTNNIFLIENVANLAFLPSVGAEVSVLPLKTRGGSGGPARIVARIPDILPKSTLQF